MAKDPSHTMGPSQGLQASLPTAAVAPIVATAAAKPASVAVSGATEPATAPPDVVASNVIAAADQQQGTPSTENNSSDVQAAVADQVATPLHLSFLVKMCAFAGVSYLHLFLDV